MDKIPAQLLNFAVYRDGNTEIGIADLTLPEIAYISETLTGAGIYGEIDMPALGQLQSMTCTVNWNSLFDDNIKFIAPQTYHLEFWGSLQIENNATGLFDTKQIKVVIKGKPKKFAPGDFKPATMMGTNAEFEVTYYSIFIGGEQYLEIDKLNGIFMVDGIDYLESMRQDLGKA